MPLYSRSLSTALAGLVLLAAAPALGQTASQTAGEAVAENPGAEIAAPSPYARGAVPAYRPPEPIVRPSASVPATAAAPVGAVTQEGAGSDLDSATGATAGGVRPVTAADPVYSDPDLAHIRRDPYSLSRHTAAQAGGVTTPYAPPED
ncbi:MAG: hypothetical protein RIB45_15950 [Marivibrio sp.]|uniref:hypothetical protein n=1 Tax=Marivibrio sp. TaxID=2039719 RepID=UPI0032EAB40F